MIFTSRKTLSLYWRVVIRPHLGAVVLLCGLMLIGACLEALSIGLTVPLMDVLTDPSRTQQNRSAQMIAGVLRRFGFSSTGNVLVFALLVLVCALFVVRSAFFVLHGQAATAIAVRLRCDVRRALFARFLRAPYETVTQWARGTVVYRINDPPDAVYGTMLQLAAIFSALLNCIFVIGLMVYLSWWVTLAICFILLGGVQAWRWFSSPQAQTHGRFLFDVVGEQTKLEVDAIDGLKVVKAHDLEGTMVALQERLLRAEIKPKLIMKFFAGVPAFFNEVSASALILGLGALTFLLPQLGIRFSMLVAFLLSIRRMAAAAASMNNSLVMLSGCRRSVEVAEEVLHLIPQERRGGQVLGPIEEIRLENIAFSYASRSDQRVLDRVSAVFSKGTVTALVGPTGSGKSTIANLLIGLYAPGSGAIRVNGIDISLLDLAAWRKRIGYVSQDIFVFNATIRQNIALWDDGISPRDIEWAVQTAQLHEFVVSLPHGYDTVVGDRGLRLSGGQCQRLAIARAILRHPEVLIFDEATSALDNLTERAVYDAIQAMHKESIVLVVAHRLSTVKNADQILVLQGGRVIEAGIHAQLMEQKGCYAKLYDEGDHSAGRSADPKRDLLNPVLEGMVPVDEADT